MEKLIIRNVGRVIDIGFKRKPSFLSDLACLARLIGFFSINRFDIVIYSTPKALLLGSIASAITAQKNRIAMVRGRAYENFSGKKRAIFRAFDILSCRLSNRVLFISESLRNAYLEEKISCPAKSLILGCGSSNGVSTEIFSPEKISELSKIKLRRRLGISDQDFLVISIGRICIDKGIRELESIIKGAKNKKTKFLVVGRIEDNESSKIIKDLRDNGLIVYVPHTEKPFELLAIADIHLFLSHREGFGNVAIEAASCNIPTIAYDVIGVKDSVMHGVSGYRFPLGETSEIIKILDKFSKNREGLKREFKHARSWAVENFDQTYVWANYTSFLKSRLNTSK